MCVFKLSCAKGFVNTSNINCIMIACNLFPMSLSRIYLMKKKLHGQYDAVFRRGQDTRQILFVNFKRTRQTSRSKSRSRNQDISNMAFYRRRIPNCSFTSYDVCFTNFNML